MAKLGISIPDELAQKLDSLAKDKGKTVSAVVADALAAYFSQNGKTTTPSNSSSPPINAPPQEPPPVANPSTPVELRLEYFIDQLKQLNEKYEDLDEKVSSDVSILDEIRKDRDEFDKRLSKLWHDLHDK